MLKTVSAAGIAVSPDKLDFTASNVQEFIIMNPNDFEIDYELLAPDGITLSKNKGSILPKNSEKITARLTDRVDDEILVVKATYENNGFGVFPAVGLKIIGADKENISEVDGEQMNKSTETDYLQYVIIMALSLILAMIIIRNRKSYVSQR